MRSGSPAARRSPSRFACNGAGTAADESFAGDAGASTGARGNGVESTLGSDANTAPSIATMRLAHLASGAAPIDFCYQAARAGSFVGPVLGGGRRTLDGGSADAADDATGKGEDEGPDMKGDDDDPVDAATSPRALPYRAVSKYINVAAAGPMRIAVVAAGAAACADPLATVEATLDPGKLSTIALLSRPGDGGAVLELATFTDDRTPVPASARVRVIHAALGDDAAPLAVRVTAKDTILLADRVEPRKASSESHDARVDALGYVIAPPLAGAASVAIARAAGDGGADVIPWLSSASDLDLVASSIHTAFVLTGTRNERFEVLWCADTVTSGERTSCLSLRLPAP